MSGAADSSPAAMDDMSRVGRRLRRRRIEARVATLAYCSQLLLARVTNELCIRAVMFASASGENLTNHSEIRSWRDDNLSPNRAVRSNARKSDSDFSLTPSKSLNEVGTPSAARTTCARFFKTRRSHASVGKGGVRRSLSYCGLSTRISLSNSLGNVVNGRAATPAHLSQTSPGRTKQGEGFGAPGARSSIRRHEQAGAETSSCGVAGSNSNARCSSSTIRA